MRPRRCMARSFGSHALAAAIYATGDTKAADATSVRASLGALVRYGNDWRRENGWLVYQHNDLQPRIGFDQEIGRKKGDPPRPEAHDRLMTLWARIMRIRLC